jgi:hypothetical protein
MLIPKPKFTLLSLLGQTAESKQIDIERRVAEKVFIKKI